MGTTTANSSLTSTSPAGTSLSISQTAPPPQQQQQQQQHALPPAAPKKGSSAVSKMSMAKTACAVASFPIALATILPSEAQQTFIPDPKDTQSSNYRSLRLSQNESNKLQQGADRFRWRLHTCVLWSLNTLIQCIIGTGIQKDQTENAQEDWRKDWEQEPWYHICYTLGIAGVLCSFATTLAGCACAALAFSIGFLPVVIVSTLGHALGLEPKDESLSFTIKQSIESLVRAAYLIPVLFLGMFTSTTFAAIRTAWRFAFDYLLLGLIVGSIGAFAAYCRKG